MSRSLILCEGKTDAIIIGYLLMKSYGWNYQRKLDKKIAETIKASKNESSEWYEKNGNYTAIVGVGGKDGFLKFINEKLAAYQKHQRSDISFSKILVFRDHDDDNVNDIERELSANTLRLHFKANQWTYDECLDCYGVKYILKSCLNIVPKEEEGALEKVILRSIAESEDDKPIVEASTSFVDETKDKAIKYLPKKRLVEKAKVGVVFAMMSPEKVFCFIDEILESIDWTKYKTAVDVFSELKNI